jgi:GDP-D-mannose dehydratase
VDDAPARTPDDFVIATGKQISVREFVRMSAAEAGINSNSRLRRRRNRHRHRHHRSRQGPAVKPGDVIVRVDPRYFRPAEVETLLGDPSKAKAKLGWVPEITVEEMCAEMVASDLEPPASTPSSNPTATTSRSPRNESQTLAPLRHPFGLFLCLSSSRR